MEDGIIIRPEAGTHSKPEVLVPKEAEYMGKMLEVDIVETGKHFLKGQVVDDKLPERPATVPPPLKPGQVSGVPKMMKQESHQQDDDRHPVWVQMAVVIVTIAVLLRVALLVFDEST